MGQAFEAATKAYETVKKSVSEKWESFKNKFEGTKTEMAQQVIDAKSPEDLIAAGKKLQEQGEALKMEQESVKQEETGDEMIGAAQTEAGFMNTEFDESRAAEKVETERLATEEVAAEQAESERVAAEEQAAHEELVKKTEAADQDKIAELRAKLNGENVEAAPVEGVEAVKVENTENNQEELIEKIGSPKSEMFEKYGSRMREAADELVVVSKEMKTEDEKLKAISKEYAEVKDETKRTELSNSYDEVKKKRDALNERFNALKRDASFGAEVIPRSGQKAGETYTESFNRRDAELKKYKDASMNDPHVVLRLIEAGAIGGDANGDGLNGVAERLMSDSEFVSEAIKLTAKDSSGSYAGWFWRNVSGEARANRELFAEAIKANHLNYQYGSAGWKSDPEIQKVALESGLDKAYLYKG